MAQFTSSNVSIKGIAACVPKNTESNNDYSHISLSERKLLIKTTGIEYRRVAEKGITGSDVCYEAAERLIEDLEWNKSEIELLVYVSQSRDYFAPSTATILQDRLGLPKSTIAFDSGLGCSGYVYGLSMITAYMNMTKIKKAVLLVGDISTFSLTPFDKSTYPLFGDAGTATALEYDSKASAMYFSLGTDGSGYESIILPGGCLRNPYDKDTYTMVEVEKGISRSKGNVSLNGLEVFTFSVSVMPPSLLALLSYANKTPESIDYFVMHQANLLMNETIRKKIKISAEKVPYSLRNYGNTSSASIPLTLVTELKKELSCIEKRKTLLLSGFGVGFSWASVIIDTSSIYCSKLIEI
jgi:3-oxoacyl-[acyl-carrier-protein] synthase-3